MQPCPVCGYEKNRPGAEFCEACGADLSSPPNSDLNRDLKIDTDDDDVIRHSVPKIPDPPVDPTTTAKLIAKLPNAPVTEFPIRGSALIGIFTPESGPVDIDLEQFPGSHLISKQHAEIIYQNGQWIVKDLSSTNGTYIKPVGEARFRDRINTPTPLNSGDEIAFAKIVFVFQIS